MNGDDQSPSLRLAYAVRGLGAIARHERLAMPGVRGVKGAPYTLDRARGTIGTITVDHDRPELDVMFDIVRGIIEANRCPECGTTLVDRRCPAGRGCTDDIDLDPRPDRPTSTDRFGNRNR